MVTPNESSLMKYTRMARLKLLGAIYFDLKIQFQSCKDFVEWRRLPLLIAFAFFL
jgi:hypothetical protein